jgi:hypothetical protein
VTLETSVEAAAALAPLIDPNVQSCGSVPPHGERELGHADSGFRDGCGAADTPQVALAVVEAGAFACCNPHTQSAHV